MMSGVPALRRSAMCLLWDHDFAFVTSNSHNLSSAVGAELVLFYIVIDE